MSASDPDVCGVYNDPRFRKGKAPGPPPGDGGDRLGRMFEAMAERYESSGYPHCPVCGVIAVRGSCEPPQHAHEAGCDFGRLLEERRAGRPGGGPPRSTPPDAEAIVQEYSKQIDGLFDAHNRARRPTDAPDAVAAAWPPSAEYLWRLHAACMRRRGWAVVDARGLQIDGPTQQEAFGPMRDVLSRAAGAPLPASRREAPAAIARRADETVAGLVEALVRARIPCHPGCRRNSHMTSDCPSTHFISRPCTCECNCPAGPHNAAVDAAVAKARISGFGPGPRGPSSARGGDAAVAG